ncbi:MAG: lysophospholipid acyltransferase family protein [Planctomycetota bacterium]|nr:lysophospholipid acyltransferase family protein [Planctomycetota bacterium]
MTFVFVGVTSVLWLSVLILLLPFRELRIKLCNCYGKFVGSNVARLLLGCKVVFKDREKINQSKPAIYITNHASALDIFLSMWVCPMGGCGIAKKEIAKIPLFGQLYWLSGHLLIDRSKRDKAIAAMELVANLVRRKKLSIWLWPEGTRSKTGRLLPFKKGFVHLAIATKLPLVPVVMHNTHKAWPKGKGRIYPTQIDIEVLDPIDTARWSVETMDSHIQETMQVFIEKLGDEQQPANEASS